MVMKTDNKMVKTRKKTKNSKNNLIKRNDIYFYSSFDFSYRK